MKYEEAGYYIYKGMKVVIKLRMNESKVQIGLFCGGVLFEETLISLRHFEYYINSFKHQEEEQDKTWELKDKTEFGLNVDYLHYEAAWLNGKCYVPAWTFVSDLKQDAGDWKTEGRGVLISADTIKEFNEIENKIDKYKEKLEKSGLDALEAESKYITWLLKNFRVAEFSPFANLKRDKKTIKSYLVAQEI